MKVVFIGAGNLATRLAIEMSRKEFTILQIYSRTESSARMLAELVQATATINLQDLDREADLYIFSLKDLALGDILRQMPPTKGIWVHTAGSIPLSVFENLHRHCGVIYPFQTFSKQREVDFQVIPFFIEADNRETQEALQRICSALSEKVYPMSSEKRKYIHLSGVFACNFVNHLYSISENILKEHDIPFDIVLPLIDETANKIHRMPASQAQTGPAIRYDRNVIDKHLQLLGSEPLKAIYELLSKSIHETNQ
ncbi:MAG: DUF2520 domain-containing protein [Dysgonamonadaceae bacterium]